MAKNDLFSYEEAATCRFWFEEQVRDAMASRTTLSAARATEPESTTTVIVADNGERFEIEHFIAPGR